MVSTDTTNIGASLTLSSEKTMTGKKRDSVNSPFHSENKLTVMKQKHQPPTEPIAIGISICTQMYSTRHKKMFDFVKWD
jgi:hypothetical protein